MRPRRRRVGRVKRFRRHCRPPAIASLDNFLKTRLATATKDASADQRAARGALVALAAVEAKSRLSRQGATNRFVSDQNALLLLQRVLAVDDEVQEKWVAGHKKGELAPSRLP